MTAYIVFLSVPLAFWMIQRFGLEKTFIYLWIPIFLLLPFNFSAKLPLVPLTNFMQLSMVPILFELIRKKLPEIKLGRLEYLLILYVISKVFCDFLGRGYKDAQNYAAYMIVSLIGSYIIGRYLINRREMEVATARMFVLIFILMFPMFLYELRSWVSPIYKIFSPLFPDSHMGIAIRYGVARVQGSFSHPILACVMIVAGFRLHRWLCWVGFWDKPQTGLLRIIENFSKKLPFSLKTQISILFILMALMTISRGPWIGALVGAALVAVGNFRNRKIWLWMFVIVFITCGVSAKFALDVYTSSKLGAELSEQVASMLYRKEMLDRYQEFLLQRVWTGWGLTTVPKIEGMESVDNAFFLMALQHGIITTGIWVTILVYAVISQIKFGLKAPVGDSPIGFTFAGIYLAMTIAFTTVYMGNQTEPLIFLLLGWGEGVKRRGLEPSVGKSASPATEQGSHSAFKRVIT